MVQFTEVKSLTRPQYSEGWSCGHWNLANGGGEENIAGRGNDKCMLKKERRDSVKWDSQGKPH